jgi:hypothetical protein
MISLRRGINFEGTTSIVGLYELDEYALVHQTYAGISARSLIQLFIKLLR